MFDHSNTLYMWDRAVVVLLLAYRHIYYEQVNYWPAVRCNAFACSTCSSCAMCMCFVCVSRVLHMCLACDSILHMFHVCLTACTRVALGVAHVSHAFSPALAMHKAISHMFA